MLKFKILLINLMLFSFDAQAYLGLGPLIPFIGQLIIFLFTGIIIILGIVVYPIKLFLQKIKNKKNKKKI